MVGSFLLVVVKKYWITLRNNFSVIFTCASITDASLFAHCIEKTHPSESFLLKIIMGIHTCVHTQIYSYIHSACTCTDTHEKYVEGRTCQLLPKFWKLILFRNLHTHTHTHTHTHIYLKGCNLLPKFWKLIVSGAFDMIVRLVGWLLKLAVVAYFSIQLLIICSKWSLNLSLM